MNNSWFNPDCPPLMSDGRHVTDYRPSCELHSSIRYLNGLYDSNQYRQFLIHNGEKIMDMSRDFYWNKNSCESCQFIHPDPNHNDTFWAFYRRQLYGMKPYSFQGKAYMSKTI